MAKPRLDSKVRHLAKGAGISVFLLLTPPASARTRPLSAYAPVLRYDSAETDSATSVEALTPPPKGDRIALAARRDPLPDVVYGRQVPGRAGRTWLQYWFLYATNPQDRGIVRTGRHEGDWEVVQVELNAAKRPQTVVFARHSWIEACSYADVERRGGAPVIYVAHGSHASYPHAGTHGRPWPDPDDEADGRGRQVRPQVRPLGAWARWPGRWGRSRASLVPGEMDSPKGPAFQEKGPWRDPDAYLAEARACGAGAPPLPAAALLAAALLAAAPAALAGSVLTRRRLARVA